MPPRKNEEKTVKKKKSQQKKKLPVRPKLIERNVNYHMKKWLDDVNLAQNDFQFDGELKEINSDEESDDAECNLKNLEKPLKKLLKRFPDSFVRKRYSLDCEWDKCTFETIDNVAHNNHVVDHLISMKNTGLKCLWNLCKFETDDRVDMLRHLDYHGYHTRLKTFGRGLVNIISIPTCHIDSKKRNDIPSILTDHFCYWDNCERSFPKFQDLIDHLGYHLVRDYQTGSSIVKAMGTNLKGIKVNCKWDQCELNLANVFQLKRHLKTHTNEKHIGCSNCGCLFSNKTLFINHCIRQAVSQRSFQCPVCSKSFPSEKLLKDHGRSHVNKFQCNLCGLSWQKKSVLARHIRYRHTTERPFSCEECDYKGKTNKDLESHQSIHNQGEDAHRCEVFGCEYTSRTLMALKRHDAKEHLGAPQTYACHCCESTFFRGYLLSKHLKNEHSFKLPPGHSRFIYKQDFDGYYRLQTKRVENLKESSKPIAVVPLNEDSFLEVSYEIEKFDEDQNPSNPINIQIKKVIRPKPYNTPTFSMFDESTEDSKDINDFAMVKNYKKSIKKSKLVE